MSKKSVLPFLFFIFSALVYNVQAQIQDDSDVQISVADVSSDYRSKESASPVNDFNKPFSSVEQMPQYPGGAKALMDYISQNLQYPEIAAKNGVEGSVVIRFVVHKDGSIRDIKALRSLDPSCEKEAVRIIESMPKWIPGKQNGKNVNVFYTIPITFRLAKETITKTMSEK